AGHGDGDGAAFFLRGAVRGGTELELAGLGRVHVADGHDRAIWSDQGGPGGVAEGYRQGLVSAGPAVGRHGDGNGLAALPRGECERPSDGRVVRAGHGGAVL